MVFSVDRTLLSDINFVLLVWFLVLPTIILFDEIMGEDTE
jgi:hypothetical protein